MIVILIDYHQQQANILTDSEGRDKVYSGLGLLTRPSVDNLGYFEGKFNVGSQARAVVGQEKGGHMVDPAGRALLAALVEQHLDHCKSCYSRAQLEGAINQRLSDFHKDDAPDSLKDRLKNIVDKL